MSIYITIYLKEKGKLELTKEQWWDFDLSSLTYHREDGSAIEQYNGDKYWFINDKLHREDGPAIEHIDGTNEWYINGKLHREDGPAIEQYNGDKWWYINGKRHREDGPAVEYSDGVKSWYINDELIYELTKKQLTKYMKLNNYTLAHLLTDPDDVVRKSAEKFKWK